VIDGREELIEEINYLRVRLNELEHSETERKNAQNELRESKEFLDNVINALDDDSDSDNLKDNEEARVLFRTNVYHLISIRPLRTHSGELARAARHWVTI